MKNIIYEKTIINILVASKESKQKQKLLKLTSFLSEISVIFADNKIVQLI